MKRNALLHLLNAYNPSEQEIQFKREVIEFINNNPNCFERSLEIGHITGSAWLINKKGTHALLMHHAKLDRWVQLGGHCDGNADVLAVAIKEAQEESGIMNIMPMSSAIFDIDIHLIPENPKENAHYHYDVRFLLKVASDEEIVKNSESKELRWIAKGDQLPTSSPSVVRMHKKWASLPN